MQEKSLIKKNILFYLEYKGITRYKFCKTTGITRGVIDQNNGMSEENISRFLAYYSDVNPEWLLTGKGEMLKTDIYTSTFNKDGVLDLLPIKNMYMTIGNSPGEEAKINFSDIEKYVIPDFTNIKTDFLLRITDTSLFPKYNISDIVACRRLPPRTHFEWGNYYVFEIIEDNIEDTRKLVLRRVVKSETNYCVTLQCDNIEFHEEEVLEKNIFSLYEVVGVIKIATTQVV